MPYKNEHACRLEDPGKFDRFNRVNCEQKHEGKCIDVIYGIKEGKSKIQALRYPKDEWTADAAKSHCEGREGTFEAAAEEEQGAKDIERRVFDVGELRVVREDGKPAKIEGYSAVFGKESLNLGFFTEIIAAGAFKNAIKKSDTRALFNHNQDIVLGRKSAKTLKLKEDDKGLFMEVEPPDTQLVRDMVLTPIERGDITQQSFGFTVRTEQWDEEKESGKLTRTIIEVEELYDVSPVTFPAYPDTSVALRSMAQFQKESHEKTTEPSDDGEIPEGWEDITQADAWNIRLDAEHFIQELRFKEASEQ